MAKIMFAHIDKKLTLENHNDDEHFWLKQQDICADWHETALENHNLCSCMLSRT